jgi:flavin reductase (DIM6/NTAB) family NADH-FMN oxidoreductase RutF
MKSQQEMTMITRDLSNLPKRDVYRILSSLVIPRPIAWITTVDATGRVNLAPFSSFMGIFGPPMLAVTISRRKDGSLKDTHCNLKERGEAVVHIADLPLLEALHASGAEVGPEISEVERLGLGTAPSLQVAPPRLTDAPVALECRLNRELDLGPNSTLVLLDVLLAHAAERIWSDGDDCADASRWAPLSRLASVAGPNYGALGQTFRLGASELP